ncbi:MAG: energy-coupling factor ABC transporter permease [Aquificaceae bacterium]|nr:energy-coupling factor ABC transporter permease [Aquificaceae bacterium]MDW8032411.1 energy-coupling factor ABC transporter permease [Aquificaceae bacterium]MDW8424165.1 energy-coupling factor ABC transporter permease [Aquificaceae bacterium]
MHIPDGFVAPQVYLPAYLLAVGFTLLSFRKLKEAFEEGKVPYIASLSAFAFIVGSVAVPIPGGTSVHGLGVAPIALLFGPWVAYACFSIVLLLQVILLGEGGITTYPINLLAIGLVGGFSAYWFYRIFNRMAFAVFLSGFLSTLLSAIFMSILLGVHPYLFKDPSGKPLYFPYPLSLTIPAFLLPHLLVGFAEGILTHIAVKHLSKRLRHE